MDNRERDYILVTDWEKVESEDFYLSDDWMKNEDKERVETARTLQKEGVLYIGYIVTALSYAIYYQMDADKVFINDDGDVVMNCESAIIGNEHEKRMEYDLY